MAPSSTDIRDLAAQGARKSEPLARGASVTFQVPEEANGMRLDAALGCLFTELGLRARRRLWNWCRISVNGRARKPGFVPRPGDMVIIEPGKKEAGPSSTEKTAEENIPATPPLTPGEKTRAAPSSCGDCVVPLIVVAFNHDYIALKKPAGIHSAHIAGNNEASLELALARNWSGLRRSYPLEETSHSRLLACHEPEEPFEIPRLLTRLDKATSGMVLAARYPAAEKAFRNLEKQGKVRKSYLALVRGGLKASLALRWKLNPNGGIQSRISRVEDADTTRHSHVVPLCLVNSKGFALGGHGNVSQDATLVMVNIARGARHQIRAHLAGANFPLVGEKLYAEKDGHETLYLHHARIELPGFSATLLPDWDLIYSDNADGGGIYKILLQALGISSD